VVFEETSRLRTIAALPRLFAGRAAGARGLSIERIERATIECDRPMLFHVDGEPVEGGTRLEARVLPADLTTFAGDPVVRVEVRRPADVPPLRARLGEAGVECFEADLRFAYRYLIDRGIRGAFEVDGRHERRPGVGRVYRNPALAPAEFTPRLRVLSFDVETSLDGRRLYSIAAAGAGGDHVFFVGRDLDYAKSVLDAATRENRRPRNAHHDMIVQALEFILSEDFREF